jgi:selenocysteine lyase/cysteine desulfurase
MQAIKAALAIRLKEKMNPDLMKEREMELLKKAYAAFEEIPGVQVVGGADMSLPRIGALPFNIEGLHYNLVVRLLNDYFGIQVRGGWSCASTYCHYLFDMDEGISARLTEKIDNSNMTGKPGWVRISLHPTMTDEELDVIIDAIRKVAEHGHKWAAEYYYEPSNNEYMPKDKSTALIVEGLLDL